MGKNNDGIHNDLVVVLQSVDEGSGSILSKLYPKKGAADEWEVTPQGKGENKSTRFSTISSTFQSHLNGLMDTLDGTESSFIRCINPNLNRKPGLLLLFLLVLLPLLLLLFLLGLLSCDVCLL